MQACYGEVHHLLDDMFSSEKIMKCDRGRQVSLTDDVNSLLLLWSSQHMAADIKLSEATSIAV
jgi:hypothetical protein